ncbi:hypothetical protein AB0K74_16960, partial [Streptomyces sp. NPDC056159]
PSPVRDQTRHLAALLAFAAAGAFAIVLALRMRGVSGGPAGRGAARAVQHPHIRSPGTGHADANRHRKNRDDGPHRRSAVPLPYRVHDQERT